MELDVLIDNKYEVIYSRLFAYDEKFKIGTLVCDFISVDYDDLKKEGKNVPEFLQYPWRKAFGIFENEVLLDAYQWIKHYFDICVNKKIDISKDSFMFFISSKNVFIPIYHFTFEQSFKKIKDNDSKEIRLTNFEFDNNLGKFMKSNQKKIESVFYRCLYIDEKPDAEHDTEYYKEYSRSLLKQFCVASIYQTLKLGYTYKICKNCGKWFVPVGRSDTLYCDRKSPQDKSKTCKEYGAYNQYQENLQNNEAAKLYRNIYMQKQMLVKRNSDIEEYKHDFELFKKYSKIWKSDIKAERATEEQYYNWLTDVKEKRGNPYGNDTKTE